MWLVRKARRVITNFISPFINGDASEDKSNRVRGLIYNPSETSSIESEAVENYDGIFGKRHCIIKNGNDGDDRIAHDLLKIISESENNDTILEFRELVKSSKWDPIRTSPNHSFFRKFREISNKDIIPSLLEIMINVITEEKDILGYFIDGLCARYELFYLQIAHHLDLKNLLYVIFLMVSNLERGISRNNFILIVCHHSYNNNPPRHGFLWNSEIIRSIIHRQLYPAKKRLSLIDCFPLDDKKYSRAYQTRDNIFPRNNRRYSIVRICLGPIMVKMILNEILKL